MTSSDKDKDMVFVKEPNENDVLLGQGHYRHQGNKKLNKIVDAKVDEYRNQSRVFKTYMAHDIINRMRSKGVRFLKELAPKGWIVVKDDKEAREKVAQRFQYMMRKQDAAAKEKTAKSKANTKEVASTPPARTHLDWDGFTVKVPFLPVFHQLQKSSVLVDDDINEISKRLQECFRITGMQDCFNNDEANVVLTTATDNLRMQMNLWKPLGGNRGVIVELINLEGDNSKFQKNSRYVLEAATGLFDRYKHTLFQTGADASVQDHVTTFTKEESRGQPPAPKPGMVKALSDCALHDGKKKPPVSAVCFDKRDDPYFSLRRPVVKRMEQSKLVPIAPKPPPRLVPIAPRCPMSPPAKREPVASSSMPAKMEPEVRSGGNGGCFGSDVPAKREPEANGDQDALTFASAFSRWETGVETVDAAMSASGQSNARRPSAAPRKSFTTTNSNTPIVERAAKPCSTYARPAWPTTNDSGNLQSNVAYYARPSWATTADSSNLQSNAAAAAAATGAVPNCATSSTPNQDLTCQPYPDTAEFRMQTQENCDATEDADRPSLDQKAESTESIEPLPLATAETLVGERFPGERMRNPCTFDRWSSYPSNQEMKCDSSVEERVDMEMASMDRTIETIKRLSLSSNDASLVDPRTSRDINDGLVGLWSGALSNQEMKCDSSLDGDELYGVGHFSATQSFLPSSFFGAPPANTYPRAPNPPSPAHSICSHISVEMRATPSPSPSSSSHVSVEVFSLPSPCNSFNSRCSLGVNSLKHARADETMSPSMFQSDQSAGNESEASRCDALLVNEDCQGDPDPEDRLQAPGAADPRDFFVPPTIFVDSSSAIDGPGA